MPVILKPACCPNCDESFSMSYPAFRAAHMRWHAYLILLAGTAVCAVLFPVLGVVVSKLIAQWTATVKLHRKEWGTMYLIAYGLSGIVALLPLWASWRLAFALPRRARLTCSRCAWSGPVAARDVTAPTHSGFGITAISVIEEVPAAANSLGRERRVRRNEHEADEPNPHFDFDASGESH